MRSAAEAGDRFPYASPTTCYIEITHDGAVSQGCSVDTYDRIKAGHSRLFAVWPGQWRSDLFVIDDVERLGNALGFENIERYSGSKDHEHQITVLSVGSEKPWAWLRFRFDCGCQLSDIERFASQMMKQKGWRVATSSGWAGGGPIGREEWHIRVLRSSVL